MQYYGTLENFLFRGPLYIHEKESIEQLLQNNHKNVSRPKEFNETKYTSKNTDPCQETNPRPLPRANLVWFQDPYDHIHHMDHNHENNHLIDTQEQDMENNEIEQDEFYDKKNDNSITEE